MDRHLRLALGQINGTVGDLQGNVRKITRVIDEVRERGADLVAFPELIIPGYPPEDLLLNPTFLKDNLEALAQVTRATRGITALVGFADVSDDIYNAAAILHDGELAGVYRKIYLPNYGVFDEDRYFQSGDEIVVFELDGTVVGVNICEDIWYPGDPLRSQTLRGGAQVIVNISSSPYHAGKRDFRQKMLSTRAYDAASIVVYVNLVGGQDELVFDGESMILDQRGNVLAKAKAFEEDLLMADLNLDQVMLYRLHDPRLRRERTGRRPEHALRRIALAPLRPKPAQPRLPLRVEAPLDRLEEIYRALVLGTGDYVRKNGFRKVVLGLSGGIDSALTAAIAVDALGAESVVGVAMPSRYSSPESLEDAQEVARNLGMELRLLPIDEVFQAYLHTLEEPFREKPPDEAEENVQARIRGTLLMALSNKFGWLVLTTGNKSETGVGYCTLYGDMAGGFAVIKDVPKTLVYQLAQHRNASGPRALIPSRVLEKPPSAELRPNQKDTDLLPPYEILDPILQAYVEEDESLERILEKGFDRATVEDILRRVDLNEYKRRQAPPGVKITPRAFGKDRRLPITNQYRNNVHHRSTENTESLGQKQKPKK